MCPTSVLQLRPSSVGFIVVIFPLCLSFQALITLNNSKLGLFSTCTWSSARVIKLFLSRLMKEGLNQENTFENEGNDFPQQMCCYIAYYVAY